MSKLTILLIAMLIFAINSGMGSAAELTVQPGSSIQAAVSSANQGDVIIVKPGTYNESIKISTPNLIIKSESGNPADTIIEAGANSNVLHVTASNTTISGFKIESGETGIYLSGCNGCTVTNNNLSGNKIGIYLRNANYSTVSGNNANLNTGFGIQLINCEGNKFLNNNVNSNARGINSITSNKNMISGNSASNNSAYGMWISQSNENNISGNTINESGTDGSGGGVHFNSSSGNTITGNIVASNYGSGFFECPGCHNNLVYNNYVNNVINANIKTRDTTWNKPKTEGMNIVGGPYIGGNFWATPAGTGFSETAQDKDGDGIADTEYNISNITDKLPLVSGTSKFPVANFSISVNNGYAPLPVKFSDLSQNATGRSWDFENDGIVDSNEKDVTYTYAEPKTYVVRFTAVNAAGSTSKLATITVLEQKVPIIPVANLTANVTSGNAPLTIQFTDLSENAELRYWDFGDGTNSTEKRPVHTYSAASTYNVILTVSNGNNTSSKLVTISVLGGETKNESQGLPVVELSTNVTSGYIPLAVQFTDLSRNISSRSWDIGNDGTVEDTNTSFVYVFNSRGKCPVKLTVGNEKGTSSEIIYINAQKKSSGGSGGGGGTGGSPEPAKNVKVKELSQTFITSGKPIKFDLAKNATCIVNLSFDSKKTVGKTTTIVEMLKNKSTLTPDAPEGEVYNYLNIWVGNGGFGSDEKNLENAVVNFRVEKAWMQDKDIDKSSIVLNRYSDKKWNELPTTFLREDDKYLYFKAESPGFSPFAITGEASDKKTVTEVQKETENLEESNEINKSNESNENSTLEAEHKPESEESTGTSEEEGMSTSGFEIIWGLAGILAVYINKRK